MADPTTSILGVGVETHDVNWELMDGPVLGFNTNSNRIDNPLPPLHLPEIEFPSRNTLRFAATSQPLLPSSLLGPLASLAAPQPTVPISEPLPPIDLKVITVNAYLYHSGSPVIDLFFDTPNTMQRARQLAAWIKAQDADIVFLQEVWHQPLWREIARRAGYPYAIHFGNVGGGNTDLAILSNHPLSHPRFTPTVWQGSKTHECGKDLGGNFRTGLATVTARIKGKPVLLATAHPMHRRHDEADFSAPASELTPERILQLIELWSLLKPQVNDKTPLIFGGDFNFQNGQKEAEVFRRFFASMNLSDSTDILLGKSGAGSCTFCEDNPINQENEVPGEGILDRVFVNDQLELVDAEIARPHPVFTDHQPLVTRLRLPALKFTELFSRPSGTSPEPLPQNSALQVPLTKDEIADVSTYLDDVSFSFPACLFSDFGDTNVEGARAFLGRLSPFPPEKLLVQLSQR